MRCDVMESATFPRKIPAIIAANGLIINGKRMMEKSLSPRVNATMEFAGELFSCTQWDIFPTCCTYENMTRPRTMVVGPAGGLHC